MADPSTYSHSARNISTINDQDFPPSTTAEPYHDADLEMEDDTTHNTQTQHGQDTSSSTLDHEPINQPETQQQEQQPTSSSNGPPPSRKDASLREFLSKMDDYAPIVRLPLPCPRNCSLSCSFTITSPTPPLRLI
jgi:hypothetical protein